MQEAVFVGTEDVVVQDCQLDPSRCRPGSAFVAIDADLEEIENAVKRGAKVIITDRLLPSSATQCLVPDPRWAMAQIVHQLAGAPSQELLTVGIMGTHGKTTIGLLIATMLKQVGGSVAYRTSLGCSDGKNNQYRMASDDASADLSRWLQSAVAQQCPAAVLEITDRMLADRASSGLQFDVLVIPGLRTSHKMNALQTRGLEKSMRLACNQLKKHGLVVYNADDAKLNQWIQKHEIPSIGYVWMRMLTCVVIV